MFTVDPSRTCVGYLVRHGELPNMNVWDSWADYDLSEEGKQQAEKAAQYLSFERIGRVIASDLPRSMSTAQYLMDTGAVSCPFLACDTNLRPWLLPEFQGKEKTPERLAQFLQYIENPDLVVPGSESHNQFVQRVQVAFQYLCAPYDSKPTAIFIHNSVIKALMNIPKVKESVLPGGIVRVDMDEKGEILFEVVLGHVSPEIGVS